MVNRFRHRGLRPDDVFLASFPRSGNTWLRFVLADLATGDTSGFQDADRLIPYVGEHREMAGQLPGGLRLIKTHEPYRKDYRRAAFLIRDPRDVALSYWKWLAGFGVEYSSLDIFLDQFMKGKIGGYGSWLDHSSGWIEAAAGNSEIVVVKYEDLRKDTVGEMGRLAHVAGIDATDERVEQAVLRNSSDRMHKKATGESAYLSGLGWQDASVRFVGTATAKGWRDVLNEQQLEILEPASKFYLDLDRSGD